MRICVAGAYGAFGLKHLDALKNIEDIEVVSVMGPNRDKIAVSYTHLTLPTTTPV